MWISVDLHNGILFLIISIKTGQSVLEHRKFKGPIVVGMPRWEATKFLGTLSSKLCTAEVTSFLGQNQFHVQYSTVVFPMQIKICSVMPIIDSRHHLLLRMDRSHSHCCYVCYSFHSWHMGVAFWVIFSFLSNYQSPILAIWFFFQSALESLKWTLES